VDKTEPKRIINDTMAVVDRLRTRLLNSKPPREMCPGCFIVLEPNDAQLGWCVKCRSKGR
jgi:hypothetical protein